MLDEPAKTRLLIQYKGPCSPSLSLSLSFLFSRFLSLFLRLFLDTNCARSFTEWRQLLGRLRKKFSERVESGRVALADSAKSVLPARSLTPQIEWTSSRAPPTLRVSGRVCTLCLRVSLCNFQCSFDYCRREGRREKEIREKEKQRDRREIRRETCQTLPSPNANKGDNPILKVDKRICVTAFFSSRSGITCITVPFLSSLPPLSPIFQRGCHVKNSVPFVSRAL